MARFRLKSHHHAQLLSAFLFLLLFNFQSCARVKLQTASVKTVKTVKPTAAITEADKQ